MYIGSAPHDTYVHLTSKVTPTCPRRHSRGKKKPGARLPLAPGPHARGERDSDVSFL